MLVNYNRAYVGIYLHLNPPLSKPSTPVSATSGPVIWGAPSFLRFRWRSLRLISPACWHRLVKALLSVCRLLVILLVPEIIKITDISKNTTFSLSSSSNSSTL